MANEDSRNVGERVLGGVPGGALESLRPPRVSVTWRIVAAPAATIAALLVQLLTLPRPSDAPFVFMFLAVAVSAWVAGPRAGLVSVGLSILSVHVALFAPASPSVLVQHQFAAACLFAISGSGVALLCGSLHSAMWRAEAEANRAQENEVRYRSLFDNMQEGLAHCRMRFENDVPVDFIYLAVNPSFERLTGLKGVVGKWVSDVIPGIYQTDPQLFEIYGRVASSRAPESFEMRVSALKTWFSVSVFSPAPGDFVAIFEVVTERKSLEEQLRQSQKMEAIGRLAGGVAHDFNNLLTAISGNLWMAMSDIKGQDQVLEYLSDATSAAESASRLTRQLLTFSRKQIAEPRVFNLNDAIECMHTMLSRILGERIVLESRLTNALGAARVDPGQFEQVLVNLAVNAADAMPDGGNLTIETANVRLDEHYCRTHPDATPGEFVMLAVSDTGCGMSREVRSRCLEPFFTTKPKSKGTGLGLSTVYGIVKQAQGTVEIYSELGHGSTFKVYFPRVDELVEPFSVRAPLRSPPRGTETILLVEDDTAVRDFAIRLLRRQGYSVLSFGDSVEALRASVEFQGEIHLLLTDVVMPHMNGRQLSEVLKESRPNVRVLFTSGYTENIIAHQGILEDGIHFISKPFAAETFVNKVREVLDG